VGGAVAADLEASTDKVSVQYMGASGGMKIFEKSNTSKWIMVQQEKLEEVTDIKGQPNTLNMAGGDAAWTGLEKVTVEKVDTYTTTFSKTMGDATFSLSAHISTGEVDITEPVPCSGCNVGTGYCTKSTLVEKLVNTTTHENGTEVNGTLVNITEVTCSEDDSSSDCATGFAKCEETVTIPKDELKFSIQVHNWPFKSEASKLTYAIVLKQKDEGGAVTESGTSTRRFEVADGGYVVLPTKGKIVGGATTEDIDVAISTEMQGPKYIINFEFPYFAPGKTLYYDPNLGISTDDTDGADDTTTGADDVEETTTTIDANSPAIISAASCHTALFASLVAMVATAANARPAVLDVV
jgi:hypothetical protein